MSGKPKCQSNITAPADRVYRTGSGSDRVGALRTEEPGTIPYSNVHTRKVPSQFNAASRRPSGDTRTAMTLGLSDSDSNGTSLDFNVATSLPAGILHNLTWPFPVPTTSNSESREKLASSMHPGSTSNTFIGSQTLVSQRIMRPQYSSLRMKLFLTVANIESFGEKAMTS